MQLALLCAAIFLAVVKVAATIWLVWQPDARAVTATSFGRAVYFAGKVSPALFITVMLVRGWLGGAPTGYLVFCAIALVAAVVMAAIVVRQRATGEWYGLAHQIRERRRR